jgi:hypothetical protein
MKPLLSMRVALGDPDLLGGVLGGPSWVSWRVLLVAMMGEALSDEERLVFRKLTDRISEPLRPVHEFWGVIGRRGGKSRAIATLVVFLAVLVDHSMNLVVGERGVVLVLAQNVKQARVVLGYVVGILESVPAFAGLITAKTAEVISLTNGIDIEIRAASFRGLRGVTSVACVADEVAYWFGDEQSSNPDKEILDAIRPTLATTSGPLVCIGSPYARKGEMYATHQRHFGPHGDPLILVAHGTSRDLNPTLPQSVVDRALERDEAVAKAEYLAQFRSDLESYVAREAVEACVAVGVRERAPASGERYSAFVDPSGGSADSMTLAIGHRKADVVIIDALRECRPPFSPEAVVIEFAELLRAYRITKVVGDRYGGEWPRERFRERGISYEPAARAKSELYVTLLATLNSRRIELPDDKRLVTQLASLERRTARGGRDNIDHPPGAHDDVANCVAGVAAALAVGGGYDASLSWVGNLEDAKDWINLYYLSGQGPRRWYG